MLSAGFFFLLEKPRLDSIGSIQAQQNEALKTQADAKETLKRLQAAKKESAEIESKLIRLSKKMPEDPELASLIIEIQEVATEAGIDLVAIKPVAPVPAGEYSELKMEIDLNGYFFNTVDFLYRLENFPREIKIMSVTMSEGPSGLPQLTVSLQTNAFVLITGQVAAPPAALAPAQVAPPPTADGT